MFNCKKCIFAEGNRGDFVYCKNYEKNVIWNWGCSRFTSDFIIKSRK